MVRVNIIPSEARSRELSLEIVGTYLTTPRTGYLEQRVKQTGFLTTGDSLDHKIEHQRTEEVSVRWKLTRRVPITFGRSQVT